jgi:NADH:ubiquinone oxidoreductase subunit 6 (subunit J)
VSTSLVIFYTFAFLAGLAALGIVFSRNVFYATLLLIVCLLSLAGIYVLSFAEFVAVTQIIIYAGGILVLIIFGVMLTAKISGKPLMVLHQYKITGPLIGLSFFVALTTFFSQTTFYNSSAITPGNHNTSIHKIGILLMSDYVLPFEIAGVLLLIALIGAAVAASSFNSIQK